MSVQFSGHLAVLSVAGIASLYVLFLSLVPPITSGFGEWGWECVWPPRPGKLICPYNTLTPKPRSPVPSHWPWLGWLCWLQAYSSPGHGPPRLCQGTLADRVPVPELASNRMSHPYSFTSSLKISVVFIARCSSGPPYLRKRNGLAPLGLLVQSFQHGQ